MTEKTRKLYRSKTDRWVAGVCGGIAEYFGVDTIIIRLVALLLILSGGAGLLAYIIAWILVPEEPGEPAVDQSTPGGDAA